MSRLLSNDETSERLSSWTRNLVPAWSAQQFMLISLTRMRPKTVVMSAYQPPAYDGNSQEVHATEHDRGTRAHTFRWHTKADSRAAVARHITYFASGCRVDAPNHNPLPDLRTARRSLLSFCPSSAASVIARGLGCEKGSYQGSRGSRSLDRSPGLDSLMLLGPIPMPC